MVAWTGTKVHKLPITTLNRSALAEVEGLTNKDMDRSKNFFALGLTFWIFDRSLETTLELYQAESLANSPTSPRPTVRSPWKLATTWGTIPKPSKPATTSNRPN